MSLKILSLNVRGLRNKVKRRAVFNYARQRADVICLQETHSVQNDELQWKLEWGGDILYSHGDSNSKGVCILLGSNLKYEKVSADTDGRVVICNINDMEQKLVICNIYAPNKDTPSFFVSTIEKAVESEGNIIIVGDFNLTLNTKLDRKGKLCNNDKSMEVLNQAINDLMFQDIWRARNEGVIRWTSQRKKPVHTASRINYGLVSAGLAQYVQSVFYVPGLMSDHSAFFMSICFKEEQRGVGYWKFNNSHLLKPELVDHMNEKLESIVKETQHMDAQDRLEYVKFIAANTAQNWSINYSKDKKLIISQLYENINELEESLSMTYQEQKYNLLQNSKADLNELESEKARGVIFRTKARWTVEAEHNTKYFFGLEKLKYKAKCASTIITDDGRKITNFNEILKEQHQYYQELYKKDLDVTFQLVNDTDIRISEEQRVEIDRPITKEEMGLALKQMSNGKCPGIDGLSVDFYKFFYKQISDILYEALVAGIEREQLHRSALTGVINLIPKGNSHTRKLKSLRPITLLNVDYKVLEKILANRIKSVLEYIINMDQKGFMVNCRISVNIRKVFDIIMHASEEELEGIVMSVDFLKCFDRISFDAVFGSLEFFGFGNNFINMIKVSYNNFTAVVQNSG